MTIENKELLTQELTIYRDERPGSLERLIDALETTTIDGHNYWKCAVAKIVGEPAETDRDLWDASIALAEAMLVRLQVQGKDTILTPLEETCLHMKPGLSLDEEGQELLTLCKAISENHSPLPIGREQ